MIIVISPAKSQNFEPIKINYNFTQPQFKHETKQLISKLKHYETDEIENLMKISPKLAQEVFDKHNTFNPDKFDNTNAKAAIFTFSGDVYKGLNAKTLDEETINYSQEHLLILSGLYGLLRPLDLIQAYRLEMSTKVKINNKILHKYWQNKITVQLNKFFEFQNNKTLINLASSEYSQAIDKKLLNANWLDIDFKENKSGSYKTISIYAKKARGLMARFILTNKIDDIQSIKKFNVGGYQYNPELSQDNLLCFTR
ncbi:peroxide stress protein YaaA [Allofrancisella guangzhouensis]|uniref:UPF0246 protein SD28_02835 n=1 Tax=Allofrancisella guangzhouensis TaxID=594679 RepID=A0A0A8E932_9GAMM|nr:peroxide stress protein YaaA [Allofrancisella guangzhouensis]AJC48656.1 hypothetical protein SD28_02835 [Allofrancisella guangzhouensis]MBK2027859.1 peroxide stress protein YaaA [Allofrancisella guangzhouensis]MBK2044932.1 peroxide stress protein YaaA [Allofrancisella guangzhouensis]MBK2046454.1 peroxide stress protein YaaA [Allofrancisella guangzhouensis]